MGIKNNKVKIKEKYEFMYKVSKSVSEINKFYILFQPTITLSWN